MHLERYIDQLQDMLRALQFPAAAPHAGAAPAGTVALPEQLAQLAQLLLTPGTGEGGSEGRAGTRVQRSAARIAQAFTVIPGRSVARQAGVQVAVAPPSQQQQQQQQQPHW